MPAPPYMQLYVSDYLGDTGHLSTIEHGAYLLLILDYWQKEGAITAKTPEALQRKLAIITRLTPTEWEEIRPTLEEFFTVTKTEWRHTRIELEMEKLREKSAKAKSAGEASAAKRSGSKSNGRSTDVQQAFNGRSTDEERTCNHNRLQITDTDNRDTSIESSKLLPKTSERSSKPTRSMTKKELEEKFLEFWEVYPKRGKASNPRKPAFEKFCVKVKNGADPDEIIAGAKRYAKAQTDLGNVGTALIAQSVTWLNQERWADDHGEAEDAARESEAKEWAASKMQAQEKRSLAYLRSEGEPDIDRKLAELQNGTPQKPEPKAELTDAEKAEIEEKRQRIMQKARSDEKRSGNGDGKISMAGSPEEFLKNLGVQQP